MSERSRAVARLSPAIQPTERPAPPRFAVRAGAQGWTGLGMIAPAFPSLRDLPPALHGRRAHRKIARYGSSLRDLPQSAAVVFRRPRPLRRRGNGWGDQRTNGKTLYLRPERRDLQPDASAPIGPAALRDAAQDRPDSAPQDRDPQIQDPAAQPAGLEPEEFASLLEAAGHAAGTIPVATAAGLVEMAASLFWPAMLLVLYDTGLRITATMTLTWTDVNTFNRAVRVPAEVQKQDEEQYLDLADDTWAALLAIREPARDLVFPWPYDRSQRSWPALNRAYRKILVAAGLPATSKDLFHKVRRTTASQLKAPRRQSHRAARPLFELGDGRLSRSEHHAAFPRLRFASPAGRRPAPLRGPEGRGRRALLLDRGHDRLPAVLPGPTARLWILVF